MDQGNPVSTQRASRHPEGVMLARCRPGPALWLLAGVLAAVGGLGIADIALGGGPGNSSDAASRWFFAASAAAFLIPALLIAAWQLRARVIAGRDGLWWRGLGCWRFAAWAELSDFYDKPVRRSQQVVIETNIGTIQLSEQGWSDLEHLRKSVEQHASIALASTWGSLGMRSKERWPLVFGYHRTDRRIMGVIIARRATNSRVKGWEARGDDRKAR